jgi:hypothetical protein
VPGEDPAEQPGHASHAAGGLPRAELRQPRLLRRDEEVVRRRGRRPLDAALPRGAHRHGAGRQRGGALLPRRRLRPGLPPRRHRRLPPLSRGEVRHGRGALARLEHAGSRPRDGHAAGALRRHPGERSRAAPRLDGVPRGAAGRRHEHLPRPARGVGARWHPHVAQLPAGRGGDAAQRRATRLARPDRARLLPPGQSPGAPAHRAAHDRAGQSLRGARLARLRRRDRRRLPAVLLAHRREGRALHASHRPRLRAAWVQPVHGGGARSLGRLAHRFARRAPP